MPGTATKTTELRIATANKIGAMVKLSESLKQNNINIECFCGYEMADNAVFYLLTSNNAKAKTALAAAGYTVTENPVVLWTVDNTPGEIYLATTALAEAKINIHYAYSTTVAAAKTASVIFATDNTDKAFNTLTRL